MAPPRVSIVIPSYQQARFLRDAIDSVLDQDHEPLDVFVADGGSSDGTVEILRSYGDRIRWCSGPDGGQCDAINAGFRACEGEVVAWLNSDDFYYPGAVRTAVEALQREPDAALVYGEGNLVDEHGALIRRFPETVPFDLWRLSNVADYILQPTVFFRRKALFESGLLDVRLHWGLDWDLWIRMGKRWPFAYVPEVLAASRIHDDTKTSTGGFRRLRELLDILRSHGVVGWSPAGVAHTATTVARRFRLAPDEVTAEVVSQGLPGLVRGLAKPPLSRLERGLRRWLQNAQGVWADGLVASLGHVWLPCDGGPCTLEVRGRNLQVRDQVVGVRCGGRTARSQVLAPGEEFELVLPLPQGCSPAKVRLTCARPASVDPLERGLGLRRAGFVLEACRLRPAAAAAAAPA